VTPARLAAALLAAALAAPAAGYVRSADPDTGAELSWPLPVVPYHVSSAPWFPSPSCAAGAAGDPALDAALASFSAWEQSCSSLRLVYAGRIDELRTGMSGTGENLLVFRKGWCRAVLPPGEPCLADPDVDCGGIHGCFEDQGAGDRFVVALTSVLYDPETGRVFDADIEMNGWDGEGEGTSLSPGTSGPPHGWYFTCDKQAGWAPCTQYGQGGCFHIDARNTLTHEVGHLVGLAHPCEGSGCGPALQPLTMYPQTSPGDVEKRTLHPDDVAGLCAIYPSEVGGCGCGPGGAPGALALLLAAVALRRRRSRP
jgi:MYXO-CTERM domain-containing protein